MEREIRFDSAGTLLWGKFSVPEKLRNATPLVVLATGCGEPGSNAPTWKLMHSALLERGIPTFIFDFCGQGNSAGSMKDLTLSVGMQNLTDALEIARGQDFVDASKISLIGSSFGGNVCLLVAAKDPAIARIGLKSPASMWAETLENRHGSTDMATWKANGYNEDRGLSYQAYVDSLLHNTYYAATNIRCPVRIGHGDADTIVLLRQSHRLIDCLPNSELVVLPGVDHQYTQEGSLSIAVAQLTDWVAEEKPSSYSAKSLEI